MVSSESTEIEKKIEVESSEKSHKVYQWTFPGLRWVSDLLMFFSIVDSFKELFELNVPTETLHQVTSVHFLD